MAKLEIRIDGDPVLRKNAKPVKNVNSAIRALLSDMAETMYDANGVGLAAPQVGISKRIIVVDIGEGLVELINPEVTRGEGQEVGVEGCLSIPGLVGDVERFAEVTVVGLDRDGRKRWIDADGFFARALQHEIDHLNGVLFTDKALAVREAHLAGEGDELEAAEAEAEEEADESPTPKPQDKTFEVAPE